MTIATTTTSSSSPRCLGLTSQARSAVIAASERFARDAMEAMEPDASHDWAHVQRVRSLAMRLAREEEVRCCCC